jgi:hypothetical protein
MKAIGYVAGGILSIAIAFLLIGFTSAVQDQKTLVLAILLCIV